MLVPRGGVDRALCLRRQVMVLLALVGGAAAAAPEWGRLTDQQLRLHLESVGEPTAGARAELLERARTSCAGGR